MVVIETCPVCGYDLTPLVLTTNPPVLRKQCINCGFSSNEKERYVRVPYKGKQNGQKIPQIDNPIEIQPKPFEWWGPENPSCRDCPSNPRNGGDGICFCTLGQQTIY